MIRATLLVLRESFRAELLHLARAPLFIVLVVLQATTFLFLVSLFGLTGSQAPTAIVTQDQGPYAREFIAQLAATHHSFDLRTMDKASAQAALQSGRLVAIITLPDNFSDALAHGQTIMLQVAVDNVNIDMTDDIQRALPAAIVAFGKQHHFPGIRVQVAENDLIDHDTGFIPYLLVSALALDAFLIASILNAMIVAREFESKTIKLLAVAPVHSLLSILGRMLAADAIASGSLLLPIVVVIAGYHVIPRHPLEVAGVLVLCVVIFGCIGLALGAVLRRTLPVVSLLFGLGFPLYLCSGSLEPQRFDGDLIWWIAHLSPVYYAVGILEQAFHDLLVTPEIMPVHFLVLLGWAVLTLSLAAVLLRTSLIGQTAKEITHKQRCKETIRQWQPRRIALRSAPLVMILLTFSIVGGGIWLNGQQQQMDRVRHQQQALATQTAIEEQLQVRLLSDYKQQVTTILNDKPYLLTEMQEPARNTISALTHDVLGQLNPRYKAELLRFIYTLKLIDDDFHVVSLQGVDFHGCNLVGVVLSDTDLSGANFSGADLSKSDLNSATLIAVNFSGANLAGADLKATDMHGATVRDANLTGTDLAGAIGISVEQLIAAHSLAGARLPNGSTQAGMVHDND